MDEVSVYSDGKLWGLPTPLVVGSDATEDGLTMPIPTNAEVRIIDHGEHKSVMVSIKNVPRDFQEGTIYFVFNRDGSVQAKALKEDDNAGYAELIKGLLPQGEYRVCLVNKTGRNIEAISISAGGTKLLEHPTLFGGAFTESGYLDPPIAPETELQWTQGGTPHVVKVELSDVPKGFEGIIYFVIKADDTVEVRSVKKGDDKTASELVK